MDKYEFRLKTEQIQKLKNKGDYLSACKIAETIDWNKVKSNILLKGLKEKFKDDKLKELLLSTGNKVLVENSVGIWGMKNNKLGNTLMKLRDLLKK